MKKQNMVRILTVSVHGKREILVSLMYEEAVSLLIESDALPGSQEFPGVRFVRSFNTKVRHTDVLPLHVIVELQSMGLRVTKESHITVGEMKGNSRYFGTAVIVADRARRTAVMRKLSKDDNYLYEGIRRCLI